MPCRCQCRFFLPLPRSFFHPFSGCPPPLRVPGRGLEKFLTVASRSPGTVLGYEFMQVHAPRSPPPPNKGNGSPAMARGMKKRSKKIRHPRIRQPSTVDALDAGFAGTLRDGGGRRIAGVRHDRETTDGIDTMIRRLGDWDGRLGNAFKGREEHCLMVIVCLFDQNHV